MNKIFKEFFWYIVFKFYKSEDLFLSFIDRMNQRTRFFWSYAVRDKTPETLAPDDYFRQSNTVFSDVAIVLQGPIKYEDDFTLETIKYYHQLFPETTIILSTWETENQDYLASLDALGIKVIFNKPPQKNGVSNVNYQIISSLNGIRLAKSLGLKYALKTRTDQRMYDWRFLRLFTSALTLYPLKDTHVNQQRLIIVNMGTLRFVPYHGSDFLMFGNVNDMESFWNQPLYDNQQERVEVEHVGEIAPENCPEVYLYSDFARKTGCFTEKSLSAYYAFLRDFFCIFDQKQIDLFWLSKYQYAFMKEQLNKNMSARDWICHADWLYYYTGEQELPIDYSKTAKLKWQDKVKI